MKILLVHPGASVATQDVFGGLAEGLEAHGVELLLYSLDSRITRAGAWLQNLWRKRADKTLAKPTPADVLYLAGQGVLERALTYDVDWVIIVSGMYLLRHWVQLLHKAHIPTGIVFTESPYDDGPQLAMAGDVDVCWTNERTSTRTLRSLNPHTFYLPHAWSAARVTPPGPEPDVPAHDVVFVGTLFQERVEALSAVDWTGIDFGLYGVHDLLGSRHKLRRYIRGHETTSAQTAALYRRATIGLNLYRTSKGFGKTTQRVTGAESLNPRAYELAATGCFSISDYRAEVPAVFGDSVPTFRSPEAITDLLRHWLADEQGRRHCVQRALAAVQQETWTHRAARILRQLASIAPLCPLRPASRMQQVLTPA